MESFLKGIMSLFKRKQIVSQEIRDSARLKECTMRSSYCNHNPETTILAHADGPQSGKGYGIKADDIFSAYLCSGCHEAYDNHWFDRKTRGLLFLNAMMLTQRILYDLELIRVPSSEDM